MCFQYSTNFYKSEFLESDEMKNQLFIEDFLRAEEIAEKQRTLKNEKPDISRIAKYINYKEYRLVESNGKEILPEITRKYNNILDKYSTK